MINCNDNQKPLDEPIVTATEIAAWTFCPEAWRLEFGLKLKPGNARERAAGERHHVVKAHTERTAGGSTALGHILIALAALLAAFLAFRWW